MTYNELATMMRLRGYQCNNNRKHLVLENEPMSTYIEVDLGLRTGNMITQYTSQQIYKDFNKVVTVNKYSEIYDQIIQFEKEMK